MRLVAERAGVTAAEIAQATGRRRNSLNTLLGRLATSGELHKQELPGGQTGYTIASSVATDVSGGSDIHGSDPIDGTREGEEPADSVKQGDRNNAPS